MAGMKEKTLPSVAVIMLNFNQWQMSKDCAESVLKSEYDNFRLLLIDNGSFDVQEYQNLRQLVSKKCEVFRIQENCGYVGGVNFGLKKALDMDFDIALIMNNDAVIDKNALPELVKTLVKRNYNAIVTGKVYHFDKPNEIQHIGYNFTNPKSLKMKRIVSDKVDDGSWDDELEMDMIDDIFWLFPLKLYKSIGGYSNYFWFNAEQADFALRALKAGYKLIYTPKAKLYHKGSISIGGRIKNPKLVYYNVQAALILRYLHLPLLRFFLYYNVILYRIVKNYLKYIIKASLGKEVYPEMLQAELYAFIYFNKWLFLRQTNNGSTPFDN